MKTILKVTQTILSIRFIFAGLIFFSTASAGFSQLLNKKMVTALSDVNSTVTDGEYTYIGGNFTELVKYTGRGAILNATDGKRDATFPVVDASVMYVIVPDGSGGWYVGGSFTSVEGKSRTNLARINADGTVHDWNPAPNGIVRSIAISGNDVYVGGDFGTIGGLTRNRLAKLNNTTGAADPDWNPSVNDGGPGGVINTIVINGSDVFVGGVFSAIGGGSRNNAAKINTNGTLNTSWTANIADPVNAMAASGDGNFIYIGGQFTRINGTIRSNIGRVSYATGALDSWNPGTQGAVRTMAVSGNDIYIGGSFIRAGNPTVDRSRVAKLNSSSNTADATWDADLSPGTVNSVIIKGNDIYIAGSFTTVSGDSIKNITKVNNTTGAPDINWNPNPNGSVNYISTDGTNIAVGGPFIYMSPVSKNYLARINNATGELDAGWNPDPDGIISSLALSGNDLYVSGMFTAIGGQTRNRIAKLNKNTGTVDAVWNPDANDSVRLIKVNGSEIYAGGKFTSIGGQPRNRIARLNNTTGAADVVWNPDANATVLCLAINGTDIYTGGEFTSIGGQTRSKIAKLNSVTGTADALWNPNPASSNGFLNVSSIVVNGNNIYTAGYFTSIGGQSRNSIAKLNNTNGDADANWSLAANGSIYSLALCGDNIFIGGNFTQINGQPKLRIAKINAATGIPDPDWNSFITTSVLDINILGSRIFVGGYNTPSIWGHFAEFLDNNIPGVGKYVASGSGDVNFNDAGQTTAVTININAGAGAGAINVFKYDDAPANVSGIPDNYSNYRWIIQQEGFASTFSGTVKFRLSEIPVNGITNPNTVTVYSRPTPGTGAFTPLPTVYNSGTGELIATVTSFSEFAFGSPDNELPVELASFTSSVNGNNAKLNWSTVSEENNSGFEIQRTNANENNWKKISFINGNGTTNESKNYSYEDKNIASGKYQYRLKQVDFNGNYEYFNLSSEIEIGVPKKFNLSQNYPNPFNPNTVISYQLSVDGFVSLKVYDITGKEIVNPVNKIQKAGYYTVEFNSANLASGMYVYRIEAGEFSATKKMVLVK
jgi:hypothetical protein